MSLKDFLGRIKQLVLFFTTLAEMYHTRNPYLIDIKRVTKRQPE